MNEKWEHVKMMVSEVVTDTIDSRSQMSENSALVKKKRFCK